MSYSKSRLMLPNTRFVTDVEKHHFFLAILGDFDPPVWNPPFITYLSQHANLFRNNYQNFFYKNASRSRLVSRATMIWNALDFHDLRDCSKYPYCYNWINRKFFISLWSPIIYEISILLQSMIQNFISIKNFW